MSRLIWTLRALADVRRPYSFIASKDVKAAQRAVKASRGGVKILADRPRIGRPIAEWLIDFGNSGHVALYRFDGEIVAVLVVRHQKQAGY